MAGGGQGGACPVHCRMLCISYSLYPSDANSMALPHVGQPKVSPDIAKCPLGGEITPD